MEDKPKKHPGGRPRAMTEEKARQLKALCRMKPTLADCAAFLEISEDTIEKYCKSLKMRFTEFREQNAVHTRFMVVRNIIKQCENGNTTMLIYASKNLCNWSDTQKIDHSSSDGSMTSEKVDLSRLSTQELESLLNLQKKVKINE